MTNNKILDAALEYAAEGIAVLPTRKDNKHPYTEHGSKDATTDAETIKQWWKQWPDANVAIATGKEHGIVVVDLDCGHTDGVNGKENLGDWQRINGKLPEDSWTANTPTGGQHLYFKTDRIFTNIQDKQPDDLKGVDIRGAGGYVVAPPSENLQGQPYYWDIAPDEMPLICADDLIAKLYDDLTQWRAEPEKKAVPKEIKQGERNGTLTSLAGSLLKLGFTEDEICTTLKKVNEERCNPALPDKEIASIAKSVSRYDRGDLQTVPTEHPQQIEDYRISDYINTGRMNEDISRLRKDANRKTGFKELDDKIGALYSGLYVVGGISSVGKTTFAAQLADQLAATGQHVLFFSLEQSRLELVSKAISRNTMIIGGESHAVTSTQIRLGARGQTINQAYERYANSVGDRLCIIEGNYDCDVPKIGNFTAEYIKKFDARPVVIIDYLQVISAAADPMTGKKSSDIRQVINDNMTMLKRISRKLEIPVIVVSSVNRDSYLYPIDFESFKESGNIEYTADVIWGLQLQCMNEGLFGEKEKKTQKRDRIKKAKAEYPRKVELVCLKNRYGTTDMKCDFKYYQRYDLFEGPEDDFEDAYMQGEMIFNEPTPEIIID